MPEPRGVDELGELGVDGSLIVVIDIELIGVELYVGIGGQCQDVNVLFLFLGLFLGRRLGRLLFIPLRPLVDLGQEPRLLGRSRRLQRLSHLE